MYSLSLPCCLCAPFLSFFATHGWSIFTEEVMCYSGLRKVIYGVVLASASVFLSCLVLGHLFLSLWYLQWGSSVSLFSEFPGLASAEVSLAQLVLGWFGGSWLCLQLRKLSPWQLSLSWPQTASCLPATPSPHIPLLPSWGAGSRTLDNFFCSPRVEATWLSFCPPALSCCCSNSFMLKVGLF